MTAGSPAHAALDLGSSQLLENSELTISHHRTDSALATMPADESSLPSAVVAGAAPQPLPGMTRTSRRPMRAPRPSLLGTLEFKLYYVIYVVAFSNMVYTMCRASSPARPEYEHYRKRLSPGWMLGRRMDLSDGQWRTFRSHLPAFASAMFAYVALNRIARYWAAGKRSHGSLPTLWFPCAFATVFVVVLSGASVVFILLLTAGSYALTKAFGGRRWAPLVFWVYNLGMLFANEHFRGYSFAHIAAPLAPLDHWRGVLRRWDVTFNLTMLRMVSFAMDYHWRVRQEDAVGAQQVDSLAAADTETAKQRVERSRLTRDYCFVNYWAYLLYPPLYMTGPIITFNDFIAQMRRPAAATSAKTTLIYGVRLVLSGLLMELVLHMVYCVAISKWAHWDSFTAYEISMLSYMRLIFIWLKLLIIWRFARFWAMVDGLETVENMRRCMNNNYSLQQFWRDWHCSYNRWLVRYVYIPLGGRTTSPWNTFVIFTFVALWHDLTLRLLQWAWIIALMFIPEGLATWFFNRPRWNTKPYFRFLCSMGGALNIVGMMIGNLVGFGDDGVDKMLAKIFSWDGALFLAITYPLLNMHLQVMFELREHEYRKEYAALERRPARVEMAALQRSDRDQATPLPSRPGSAESSASLSHSDVLTKRQKSAAERA
ncbi:glycerol transporter [Coemansia sp. RSA 552]|nr:glycerol transporter [Coemansia sp. RSA 552]